MIRWKDAEMTGFCVLLRFKLLAQENGKWYDIFEFAGKKTESLSAEQNIK